MLKRVAFAWVFCVSCLTATGLRAEDFRMSPLPLAGNARIKPERTAFDMLDAGLRKDRTRHSVLIGMHDWDALEEEYKTLESGYLAKSIDADEYVRMLWWFAPDNGKIQLADLEQWAKERPQSYIAWLTLGVQYQNAAWDERGEGFASRTSREQFAEMEKYGELAHAALRRSIPLAPKPIASYKELIGAAAQIPRPAPSWAQPTFEVLRSWIVDSWIMRSEVIRSWLMRFSSIRSWITNVRGGPYCPAESPPTGDFATSYDEQLHYVCLASATDPELSIALTRFLYFQTPRWGGNFEDSENLLSEFEAAKRVPAKTLGIAKARMLSDRAAAIVQSEPKVAIQYWLNAFDLDPRLRNVGWLREALDAAVWGAKDSATAVACTDKLIALMPDDAEAWASRGWAYEAMGDQPRYMENMAAAALLGKKEAQNNVGYYYMVGQRGLPRNLQQARAWLTLAADQGFQHSRDKLPVVEEMIRKEGQN